MGIKLKHSPTQSRCLPMLRFTEYGGGEEQGRWKTSPATGTWNCNCMERCHQPKHTPDMSKGPGLPHLRAGGRQVPRWVEKAEVSTVVGHREGGWRLFVLQFLGLSCTFEGHWSQGKSDETSLENSPCGPPLQFHEHFLYGQDICGFPKLMYLTPNVMVCEDGTFGESLGWDGILSALRRRLTARQEARASQEESSHPNQPRRHADLGQPSLGV